MGRRGKNKKQIISQGESYCGNYLRQQGIVPIPQYRIPQLPRYRYDYYFSHQGRDFLLEVDGQQHFEMTTWFHRTPAAFEKARRRDLLKSSVALLAGYTLIRIAYPDLPRFDDLLGVALKNATRLHLSNQELYLYLRSQKIPLSWIRKYTAGKLRRHLLPDET